MNPFYTYLLINFHTKKTYIFEHRYSLEVKVYKPDFQLDTTGSVWL